MMNFYVNQIGSIKFIGDDIFIKIDAPYIAALNGVEDFSHINVLWWFNHCDNEHNRNILEVKKPYKASPEILGTFATRSPERPNPIALSTVQIINVDFSEGLIQIPYIDAEDNSPVLDLKPYTPSLDRVDSFSAPTWCSHWPKNLEDSSEFNWEEEFNF